MAKKETKYTKDELEEHADFHKEMAKLESEKLEKEWTVRFKREIPPIGD